MNEEFQKDEIIFLISSLSEKNISKVQNILQNNFNYDEFFNFVRKKGVASLIYYNLSKYNSYFKIPQLYLSELKWEYEKTIIGNILIYKEVLKILNALKDNDIEIILLKGIIFSKTLYENIGLRPLSDVDFLIKEDDVEKLRNILLNSGYEIYRDKNFNKIDRGALVFITNKGENNLRVQLDFHWELVNLEPLRSDIKWSIESLWQNAEDFNFEGINVKTLSPEDHILYLIYHNFFHHGGQNLINLIDVIKIVNLKHYLDWKYIIKSAEKLNLQIAMYLTLMICKKYVNLDDAIFSKLKNVNYLSYKLCNAMFKENRPEYIYLYPILLVNNNFSKIRVLTKFIISKLFYYKDISSFSYGLKACLKLARKLIF